MQSVIWQHSFAEIKTHICPGKLVVYTHSLTLGSELQLNLFYIPRYLSFLVVRGEISVYV